MNSTSQNCEPLQAMMQHHMDLTFGTLPVQARELLTGYSKSLIAAHEIFGCSRLTDYHYLLGKIMENLVTMILSAVCSEAYVNKMKHPRTFCLIKDQARDK